MQVAERIHAIKVPFCLPIGNNATVERFVYVYLIYGDEICLIDSGVAGTGKRIFDYLKETGRDPSEISTLILTHSHPDHMGASRAIYEATGCRILAHPAERDWIEDTERQARERPVPGFHSLVDGPVTVDQTIGDGDRVELEGAPALQVFHTPGHSRGSISLLLEGDRALFCGDAVPLKGDIPVYEDLPSTIRSLQNLRDIPRIAFLLSSWDDPRIGGEVYHRLDESLHWISRIHDRVVRVSGDAIAADPLKICRQVFRELGLPETAINPLIARTIEAHLDARDKVDLFKNV